MMFYQKFDTFRMLAGVSIKAFEVINKGIGYKDRNYGASK